MRASASPPPLIASTVSVNIATCTPFVEDRVEPPTSAAAASASARAPRASSSNPSRRVSASAAAAAAARRAELGLGVSRADEGGSALARRRLRLPRCPLQLGSQARELRQMRRFHLHPLPRRRLAGVEQRRVEARRLRHLRRARRLARRLASLQRAHFLGQAVVVALEVHGRQPLAVAAPLLDTLAVARELLFRCDLVLVGGERLRHHRRAQPPPQIRHLVPLL